MGWAGGQPAGVGSLRGVGAVLVLAAACGGPPGLPAAGAPARVAPAPGDGSALTEAGWNALAAWALEGYGALGFPVPPDPLVVEVAAGADPGELFDHAARDFAIEILDVAPRTSAETRWILRRALGRASASSPEAQLGLDVARLISSTPLWYDRRRGTIHVLGHHPFFGAPGGEPAAAECLPWHLMAHEVAHALQDHRVSLLEVYARSATYEEHVVRKCLFEGEAELRMLALALSVDGISLAETDPAWCAAELERLFGRASPSFYDAGFSYLLGELRAGGWEAVEDAVLRPRVTTRDLLAGDAARVPPKEIALPDWPDPSAVEYAWEDVVGAWGMLGILAGDYPDPEALEPLRALLLRWRGDRLCVARRTDGVCLAAWRIALSDEASARALVQHFSGAEGTVLQRGAVVDFAWSPVPALQHALIEHLDAGR